MYSIIYILDKLNEIVFNLLVLIVVPFLLTVLLTRSLVIDLKNKIITLNKKVKQHE